MNNDLLYEHMEWHKIYTSLGCSYLYIFKWLYMSSLSNICFMFYFRIIYLGPVGETIKYLKLEA